MCRRNVGYGSLSKFLLSPLCNGSCPRCNRRTTIASASTSAVEPTTSDQMFGSLDLGSSMGLHRWPAWSVLHRWADVKVVSATDDSKDFDIDAVLGKILTDAWRTVVAFRFSRAPRVWGPFLCRGFARKRVSLCRHLRTTTCVALL